MEMPGRNLSGRVLAMYDSEYFCNCYAISIVVLYTFFNDVVRLFIFWDDQSKLTVLANLLVNQRVGDDHPLAFQTGSQRGALRGGVVGAKIIFSFFSVDYSSPYLLKVDGSMFRIVL